VWHDLRRTYIKLGSATALLATLSNIGPLIATSDANACKGRFASLPGQPRLDGATYRLDLQTACESENGMLTIDYSFFGLGDGRLLRFAVLQLAGHETPAPTAPTSDVGPEIVPATFAGAAARVIQVAH
jgi:hypothetical protein